MASDKTLATAVSAASDAAPNWHTPSTAGDIRQYHRVMLLPTNAHNSALAPGRRRTWLATWAIALLTASVATAQPPATSRLLFTTADLPRLRHVCGVGTPAAPEAGWGRYAARGAAFQALRLHFVRRAPGPALPGEIAAAAFLHRIDPADRGDARRLDFINTTLEQSAATAADPLELVLALDWCWDDLAIAARQDFLRDARADAHPLEPTDSPLDARRFRPRLTALALALAVDETRDASPTWSTLRTQLLDAGRQYFEQTFPNYVAWRGLSPTGPVVAAREECDTALAVELAAVVLGRDVWSDYRGSVGRWLEHYLFETFDHPRLQHAFIRDDARAAPTTPTPQWSEFLPLTAHLIATRTHNAGAVAVAERVETAMNAATADPLAALWRWVPIVCDIQGLPRADAEHLPPTRNFGGAVAFRSGRGNEATGIWIEAGQPFLRRRQHFDAGHFLIYRGGTLAVGGGDDVAYEALPSKGGEQHLGRSPDAFDFEQYCTATIAHNALVFWEPARITRWYGAIYQPVGGQRCIENTCTDFVAPLDAQGRVTARQLAYATLENGGYLALDLAPAYEPRVVAEHTREYVFFWGRALVVVDRVRVAGARVQPTWVVNLPARPSVDGHDLQDAARVAGSTNTAGVWRYDDASWVRWTDGDGALWLAAPQPAPRRLRLVGGPAQKQVVPRGPDAGRVYYGGDADGFERLIVPGERRTAENAWYRLGAPTLLGPQIGCTPHWGRVELEPVAAGPTQLFVTVLITDGATSEAPPTVSFTSDKDGFVLELQHNDDTARLMLSAAEPGGSLQIGNGPPLALPSEVRPDAPLPVHAASD